MAHSQAFTVDRSARIAQAVELPAQPQDGDTAYDAAAAAKRSATRARSTADEPPPPLYDCQLARTRSRMLTVTHHSRNICEPLSTNRKCFHRKNSSGSTQAAVT